MPKNTRTPRPEPVRVMIVDDHTMVRRGLTLFLKAYDDMLMVGEADGGETAVELCAACKPDVVLMDMKMPGMDGVTATRHIHRQFPSVRILALTSFKEGNLIQNALQAGAIGYLLKDVSADELVRAIRSAKAGHPSLSPEAAEVLVRASNEPPRPGGDLTERERVVLVHMARGLNNTQIAAELVVSPSTVKSHVSNILSKLGVASRSEAVALALRLGLVD
jgi:NarL family two-component system response regulator LiaR